MIHSKKEAFKKPPFFMSYLITDPKEFGNTPIKLEKSLRNSLSLYPVDIVCFRDKESTNIEDLALVCLKICREYNISKVLINSEITLVKKLGFDGVHLNSKQFHLLDTLKDTNNFIVISCHNENDIILAKKHNANAVTYSPIFFKEDKGLPKGITNLENMVEKYQTNNFYIFALGGIITNNHLNEVLKANAKGFASIRYFKV